MADDWQRQFPDYYEMIKHPMCLEMVETKLNAMEYQTLREICGDLGQMFTNAKRCRCAISRSALC